MSDDMILGFTAEELQEMKDSAIVAKDDLQFLEYYSRRKAALQNEINTLELQHARRVKSVEREIAALEYFNGSHAENVARKLIQSQKKGKSYDTPYGRFSVRDTSGYVKVRDPQQFIEGLQTFIDDPDDLLEAIVEYKAVVDSKAIKQRFKTLNGRIYLDGEELTANQINASALDIVEAKSTLSFNIPRSKEE
jgi:hypothetical protein